MFRLKQYHSGEFWSHGDRPWYPALGVSTLLHITAVIVLGLVWTRVDSGAATRAVESRWAPDSRIAQDIETAELFLPVPDASIDPGGRSAAALTKAEPVAPSVAAPTASDLALVDADADAVFANRLAEKVSIVSTGNGNGEGSGTGDGRGRSFFGIKADGRRFVYVVDCSGSMNHPHESEWKTRFRRLKFEILQSVGAMTADQEFFIIFFSDEARPMPANSLQPATTWAKQRYLKWMAGRTADGDTEPLDAMALALRLQPDVIYFLTDGSFNYRTNETLKKLHQNRTAIHTFCFGDAAGEEVLRFLAQNNRGEYHFIP